MLKIGVFGAYRGKAMIDVLMLYREAALVAVCDKYKPALDKIGRAAKDAQMDVALYTNFDDFIRHDMDAVILANYANEHATYAIRCLKAGKHVLSEVLPCETMAQAVALIEAVEETGLVYAYAENYCYMPDTFEMWRRFSTGEYGDVVYAEGEYVHDCSICWPQISYGDKTHWRNRMYPTFYCTHSLGPIMTITGRRPVKVVGYETPPNRDDIPKTGRLGGAGIEMVTLDNGAVIKSLHGGLKREPAANFYMVYGEKGMMESGRNGIGPALHVYQEEKERVCCGEWERYDPEITLMADYAKQIKGHHGSDFYATYAFIQKILGKPDGKWSIDVYQAVDMGICGILAWRSALNGNSPITVPNLRNKEERDAYRGDHACANPDIAGDALYPKTTFGDTEVSDEIYDNVRRLWENGLDTNGEIDTVYANL